MSSQSEASIIMESSMTLEWIVITPDFPSSLQKRIQVRPSHVANAVPNHDPVTGRFTMGGMTLSEAPTPDADSQEPLKVNGSASIMRAASREEVLEELKRDPYYKEGVWDPSKIQIIPFICAMRKDGGYHKV